MRFSCRNKYDIFHGILLGKIYDFSVSAIKKERINAIHEIDQYNRQHLTLNCNLFQWAGRSSGGRALICKGLDPPAG